MSPMINNSLYEALISAGVSDAKAKAAAECVQPSISSGNVDFRDLYLDLMMDCILNMIYEDKPVKTTWAGDTYSETARENGTDWPSIAHSMIGKKRMKNIQTLAEIVIKEEIPGDFIETGVWRGGASIFMRAILKAYNQKDRCIWVADSFEGLPRPNPEKYPADLGDRTYTCNVFLGVSLEEVKANFQKYKLLDEQVKFLKGWFKDTLPTAPLKKLAILRADGDMYESTMDSLSSLYGKLSPGGFVIIDDYCLPTCKKAVSDFMDKMGIHDSIVPIDNVGVYWRKTGDSV